MRITNVSKQPRYVGYVGVELKSNATSADKALDNIFNDTFRKDLEGGAIQIKLSAEERGWLEAVLKADAAPRKVYRAEKPKAVAMKRTTPPGQPRIPNTPKFVDNRKPVVNHRGGVEVITVPEDIPMRLGDIDLSALQRHNKAKAK